MEKKTKKSDVPEDLGLKIVSKEEKLWHDVRDKVVIEIENLKKSLTIQEAVLQMCEQKIKDAASNS